MYDVTIFDQLTDDDLALICAAFDDDEPTTELGEPPTPEHEPYEPSPEDWEDYCNWSERREYERRFGCNARFV